VPFPEPVAERRWASVLFADLVGFTTLSESRDPEQVRELLSGYFDRCREIITAYDGVVEKFIGDAVMAVWGVPTAHEDDAERAVRAGLDLAAMVTILGEQLHADLALRVGVVTGEVAATLGATSQGMVAGDPVNTAARVQTAAEPGRVYVDGATRSLTAHAIDYDDTGERTLKGKSEPERLFVARAAHEPRRSVDSVSTFVGRGRELAALSELVDMAAAEGRARLVVVEGEAGMGKSRLVAEFQRLIEARTETTWWHRGRCLALGQGSTFRALSDAVRTRMQVTDDDGPDSIAAHLDALLETLTDDPVERDWLRAPLSLLVDLDTGAALERGELFAAWCRFFELVGGPDPVVWVIDDAHLADDGLLDFVDHLVTTTRAGVMVIALARPELLSRRPGWGGRRATTVPLSPLSDADMRQLVDQLLDDSNPALRRAIVADTGGLPLYAIEIARAARDRAAARRRGTSALDVPHSLRALIRSRLDMLPDAGRRVVSDAAVLGLSFSSDHLASLVPEGIDLQAAVDDLRRREILVLERDRFSADRGRLRFSHAVVRQVAYDTLSRRDRKLRHLRAAEYLGGLGDDSQAEEPQIAEHLLEALEASFDDDGDRTMLRAEARHHLALAGARALALGAPSDAQSLYSRALALDPEEDERAELLLTAARAAYRAGDFLVCRDLGASAAVVFDAAGDRLRGAEATAMSATAIMLLGDAAGAQELALPRWDELKDDDENVGVLLQLGAVLSPCHIRLEGWRTNPYAEPLLLLAQQLGDPAELSSAHWRLGNLYSTNGDFVRGREHYEESLRLARGQSQAVVLARALEAALAMHDGIDLHASLQASEECLEVSTRAGDSNSVDYASLNRIIGMWRLGELRRMQEALPAALEIVSDVSVRMTLRALQSWWSDAVGQIAPHDDLDLTHQTDNQAEHLTRDAVAIRRALSAGDAQRAAAIADKAFPELLNYAGLSDIFLDLWPELVLAALAARDVDLARKLLAPVESARSEERLPFLEAQWHRLRGLTAAAEGADPDVTEGELRRGARELGALGARGTCAQAHEELGRWLHGQGRPAEATEHLEFASTEYEAIGAQGWRRRLDQWIDEHDPRVARQSR
jgi:class 3 adenylate cyclase/tetratricopeptide (TPR) repeat protein